MKPVRVEWLDFACVRHDVRGDLSDFKPSRTRQEFAAECDINTIMAKYEAGGAVSHVNKTVPVYMDMTNMPDLRGALDIMAAATTAFALLPAKVRREFDHDPQKFVDFAQSPDNLEKMREWGLAPAAAVAPPPLKVEIAGGLQQFIAEGEKAPPPALPPKAGKPT